MSVTEIRPPPLTSRPHSLLLLHFLGQQVLPSVSQLVEEEDWCGGGAWSRNGGREGGLLHPVVCYPQQSNFLPLTVMTLVGLIRAWPSGGFTSLHDVTSRPQISQCWIQSAVANHWHNIDPYCNITFVLPDENDQLLYVNRLSSLCPFLLQESLGKHIDFG